MQLCLIKARKGEKRDLLGHPPRRGEDGRPDKGSLKISPESNEWFSGFHRQGMDFYETRKPLSHESLAITYPWVR